jgi:hypothetical protein
VRKARDAARSDLSVEVASSWRGENADGPWGNDRVLSDEHLGAEALVVWRRPFAFRAEKSAVRQLEAQRDELLEAAREARLAIAADVQAARIAFDLARRRLEIVSQAVEAAERTVDAERRRFRLGEGRSRNVLDAQKDLTGAIRRQAQIATDVLRAHSDFRFAAGVSVPDVTSPEERHQTTKGQTSYEQYEKGSRQMTARDENG